MSVRLLVGQYDGGEQRVALVDSSRSVAFGPLFEEPEDAEAFLSWFVSGEAAQAAHSLSIEGFGNVDDPRGYRSDDVVKLYDHWKKMREDGLLV